MVKQKSLKKWLILWGFIFALMQLMKIKDFYFEDPFTFWFKFYWATICLLDAAYIIVFVLIQRGQLILVK